MLSFSLAKLVITTYLSSSFACFVLLVLISHLFVMCFWFYVLLRCLFDSGWKISFDQMQPQSMTLMYVVNIPKYFGDLNIVIFVGICTEPFYDVNMDVVNLFTNSFFFVFCDIELYCIDVLYQFKCVNIIFSIF